MFTKWTGLHLDHCLWVAQSCSIRFRALLSRLSQAVSVKDKTIVVFFTWKVLEANFDETRAQVVVSRSFENPGPGFQVILRLWTCSTGISLDDLIQYLKFRSWTETYEILTKNLKVNLKTPDLQSNQNSSTVTVQIS